MILGTRRTWGSFGFRGWLRSRFRVDLRNERVLQNGNFWHPWAPWGRFWTLGHQKYYVFLTTCFWIAFCIDSGRPSEVAGMRSAHAGACFVRVGRFWKGSILRSIWGSFWNEKGDQNPNYTNFGDHVGHFGGIFLCVVCVSSKKIDFDNIDL